MDIILNALRDPIWQFIGVITPVLSALVVHAFRRMGVKKDQTIGTKSQINIFLPRELKASEWFSLLLLSTVSTLLAKVLVSRVFDTYISISNNDIDASLTMGIFFSVGLIIFTMLSFEYELAILVLFHFLLACIISCYLFTALGIGAAIFDWHHIFDLQVHDVVGAREVFLSTYLLSFVLCFVVYLHDKKTRQARQLAQTNKAKMTLVKKRDEEKQ